MPELDTSGALLTAVWDPTSIMANWECYADRIHDSFNYYELSYGDKLGLSIVYPPSLTRGAASIRSRTGFVVGSGTLVRADSTIVTDWTAAGAHSDVYGGHVVGWSVRLVSSGAFVAVRTGLELSVSAFSSQNYDAVQFQYSDRWNRDNSGIDNVIVSSARHAAVTMSTQAPLVL